MWWLKKKKNMSKETGMNRQKKNKDVYKHIKN